MRNWLRWLLVVIVASIASVNTLSAIGKLYPNICQESAQTEQKDCTAFGIASAGGDWINRNGTAIQALTAIAVAWFTYVLMRVGKRQADISSKQAEFADAQNKIMETQSNILNSTLKETAKAAKAAEDGVAAARISAESELRAYVFVGEVTVSPGVNNWGFCVIIHNHGHTPAYAVRSWIGAVVGELDLEFTKEPPIQTINAVIPPGGDYELWTKLSHGAVHFGTITGDNIPKAEDVFIYGQLQYRDAFKIERVTNFRKRCSSRDIGREYTKFFDCLEGNDAT